MSFGGRHRRVLMITLGLLATHTLGAAAQTVRQRLRGRVTPEVAAAVQRIATEAERKQLPVDALIQKALEGGAKGMPASRIIAAVEAMAGRLEIAARAVGPDMPGEPAAGARAATIEAGAFALGAGLDEAAVARLVRASRGEHPAAATLRVAGAVAALGVSGQQTAELLVDLIETGQPMEEITRLPAHVQAGLSRGLSPREAAAGAARGRKAGIRGPGHPKKQKERPGRP